MITDSVERSFKLWFRVLTILLSIFCLSCVHDKAGLGNKKHVTIKSDKGTVLISFRLDDITFSETDKPALEAAVYLARKYNITFDLAVIAKPFDSRQDSKTFEVYQSNQDVFEIVAHGFTHRNPINNNNQEFYDTTVKTEVPFDIQEEHIRQMQQIFERHGMPAATKIFILPCAVGDSNTISLAQKYGYKLIVMRGVPHDKDKRKIIVSDATVGVPMSVFLTEKDISKCKDRFLKLINSGEREIEVYTHFANYRNIESVERLINELKNIDTPGLKKKFGFISEGLTKN
ncbi:MAG: DUF2334 domain-containing protein [Candidatus Omnitrophica bacterium]|nr:DUF2334 domain-containing protein [Candidatus Omnitrophota bacterium]